MQLNPEHSRHDPRDVMWSCGHARRGRRHLEPGWRGRAVRLEPLAEVERALLVVEVLHLPHPELGGLGLGNSREHSAEHSPESVAAAAPIPTASGQDRTPESEGPRNASDLESHRDKVELVRAGR